MSNATPILFLSVCVCVRALVSVDIFSLACITSSISFLHRCSFDCLHASCKTRIQIICSGSLRRSGQIL